MTAQKPYRLHTVCLLAAATLGSAAISVPYENADNRNPLAFLAAFLAAALLYFLMCPVINFIFKQKRGVGFWRGALYSVVIFLSLWSALTVASEYIDFVKWDMLPYAPKFVLSAVFAVAVYVFSVCGNNSIFKFSLFATFGVCLVVALFFVLSLGHYDIKNIAVESIRFKNGFLRQTASYFLGVFLPSVLTLCFVCVTREGINKKAALGGLTLAAAILVLCILNSILIFGAKSAANMSYPYADAISTITVGNLFTRMDGFAYIVFFCTSIIRQTVMLKLGMVLLSRLGLKFKKMFLIMACGLLFIAGTI